MRFFLHLVFTSALLLVSLVASADPQTDFKEGKKLFEDGDCAAALPLLESALEATDSPNARLYVARCLDRVGRTPEAYEQLKATVEDATARAETEDKYAPTRDSAAAELALLEPRVGRIVIAINEPPAGITIQLGDRQILADRLGTPIAVMPGRIALEVSAPDKQTETRELDVRGGKLETVTIVLSDPASSEPTSPPPAPDEPDSASSGGGARIAGYVVGGLGVVGVGVGLGLVLTAKSDFDALDSECGGVTCPASFQGRIDDGRSMQLGGNIALIAGGALAAAGLAMVIFGGGDEVEESAMVVPLDGGAMLQVGSRF